MDGDGCASCTDEFLMFATEAVYNGDFGDTIEADFLCQSAAEDAALPGIYAAWISTSQHEVMKYLPFEKPLVRTDGEPIVPHAYELAFGSLIYPISRNEYGLPVDGYAWTGTNSKGNPSNQDCNKWTSPFAFATVGQVSAPDEAWTQTPIFGPWNDCDALNHLYCFRRQ